MRTQLSTGENEFSVCNPTISALHGIVEGIYDELTFYGNCLVFLVVEVDTSPEAARGRLAG